MSPEQGSILWRPRHSAPAEVPYLTLPRSQIRVRGICDAFRERLPEVKFILGDFEPGHFLVRTATFARPEDQSTEVFAIRPVRVRNRVPKRANGVISKKPTTSLRHRAIGNDFLKDTKARFVEIHEADVVLHDDLCTTRCRIPGCAALVYPRLKRNKLVYAILDRNGRGLSNSYLGVSVEKADFRSDERADLADFLLVKTKRKQSFGKRAICLSICP